MRMINSYEDGRRAAAYAKLEFTGTYYLAYRDLPHIIGKHVQGEKAIDFGCGTGRSTRFLTALGFSATGIDIANDMIKKAKEMDQKGDYRLIEDGNFSQFKSNTYDLVLSVFTFDNIPTKVNKISQLKGLKNLLSINGIIINLVSAPEIYTHEWTSFSTREFPENKTAKSGKKVKIIITDVDDQRPVEDVVCNDNDYRQIFAKAGLEITNIYKPLARGNEPFTWINETYIPPWVIYVLKKSER